MELHIKLVWCWLHVMLPPLTPVSTEILVAQVILCTLHIPEPSNCSDGHFWSFVLSKALETFGVFVLKSELLVLGECNVRFYFLINFIALLFVKLTLKTQPWSF